MTGFGLDVVPDQIPGVKILQGDCLQTLKSLPSSYAQMCCTSPPYFGLRDYGTATWEGGDPNCDHIKVTAAQAYQTSTLGLNRGGHSESNAAFTSKVQQFRSKCKKCGATRVDDQIGLEDSPEQYIAKMVAVGRELYRVLRDDGLWFLNLGGSYCSTDKWGGGGNVGKNTTDENGEVPAWAIRTKRPKIKGLPPGNLLGIPWRVALALQADGWILRSDIIWHSTNKMPESVQNRPSKAHEYIFMFAKKKGYFYDAEAIKEKQSGPLITRPVDQRGELGVNHHGQAGRIIEDNGYRNKRSVWTVPVG